MVKSTGMFHSVKFLSTNMFVPSPNYIFSFFLCRWDIRTKKCVDRFKNEDGTISSYISATSRFLAVGAESGVVNLYNDTSRPFQKRSPVKSILNMHTSIDYMKFNPQGDILAMSSRREKDALKLVHVPTQTVFSNWPTSKTPLSYVWSLDFSPGSKFMAVGNDKGKCLLYKLSHYNDN
jgi:U3 small nucleolar RNA-associated protein 18